MNVFVDAFLTLCVLVLAAGWLVALHSKSKRADLYTDLAQLIHDGEVGHEDLRRTLDHQEIQDALERWDDDYDGRYSGALEEARKDGEPAELFDE